MANKRLLACSSWSTIDYYGNWKASHYQVKELYKPIKSMFFENDKALELHIVSDELKNKKAYLNLEVVNFNGDVLNTFKNDINIESNASSVYFSTDIKDLINGHKKESTFVVARLLGEDNIVFDESLFFFKHRVN